MGKISNRLHRPPPKIAPTLAAPIDMYLARAANASQVLLLALGVFGYFYTVLPVYQKSLLDEEIAKKTIALNNVEGELKLRETELNGKDSRLAELSSAVTRAEQNVKSSKAAIGTLRSRIQDQYMNLQPRLVREFGELVQSECKPDMPFNQSAFVTCVGSKVLPSYNLSALSASDKSRLFKLTQKQVGILVEALATHDAAMAQRKEKFADDGSKAAADCERKKSDSSASLRCRLDEIRRSSDEIGLRYEDSSGRSRVFLDSINSIAEKFYGP